MKCVTYVTISARDQMPVIEIKTMFRHFATSTKIALVQSALIGCMSASTVVIADDYYTSAQNYVYRLGDPACPAGGGKWVQTAGPSSAHLNNLQERSYGKLYEGGTYTFENTCCAVVEDSVPNTSPTRTSSSADYPLQRAGRLMASPDRVGYGRNTTGGSAASKYTVVSSLADSGPGSLRAAVEGQSGPLWIIFDESIYGGTIVLNETIPFFKPDITIDGRGSDITIAPRSSSSIPMLVFRAGNAIVHGITIDGKRSGATGMMFRERRNYWVDHVTVTNFNVDDALSIGQGSKGDTSASEITISNYHAHNTNYAILGGGEDNIKDYPPYRVTIHSSILSAEDRNPKIKNYGKAHIFNSYIHSFRFEGINAGANSQVFSESNVLSAPSNATANLVMLGNTNNGGTSGMVISKDDLFLGGSAPRGDVRDFSNRSVSVPYSYSAIPANEVFDYVNTYAGARGANLKSDSVAGKAVQQVSKSNQCSVKTRTINFNFIIR